MQEELPPVDVNAEADAVIAEARAAAEAEAAAQNSPRVTLSVTKKGRIRNNRPCPCGSGRKFKRCCRALVDAGARDRVIVEGGQVVPARPLPSASENYTPPRRSVFGRFLPPR